MLLHHEPVVTLPHVGPTEAIVAWGAFAFHVEDVLTGAGGKVTGPWTPQLLGDEQERFPWGASVPHFVVGRFDAERPEPELTVVPAGPALLPEHPGSVDAWQPTEDGTVPIAPRGKIRLG